MTTREKISKMLKSENIDDRRVAFGLMMHFITKEEVTKLVNPKGNGLPHYIWGSFRHGERFHDCFEITSAGQPVKYIHFDGVMFFIRKIRNPNYENIGRHDYRENKEATSGE